MSVNAQDQADGLFSAGSGYNDHFLIVLQRFQPALNVANGVPEALSGFNAQRGEDGSRADLGG